MVCLLFFWQVFVACFVVIHNKHYQWLQKNRSNCRNWVAESRVVRWPWCLNSEITLRVIVKVWCCAFTVFTNILCFFTTKTTKVNIFDSTLALHSISSWYLAVDGNFLSTQISGTGSPKTFNFLWWGLPVRWAFAIIWWWNSISQSSHLGMLLYGNNWSVIFAFSLSGFGQVF